MPSSKPFDTIISFWFEELKPKDWFKGGQSVDDAIRDRFEQSIDPIYTGQHDDWLDSPVGRLAAIIALDQFPRNLYRSEARSFAYDDKALALSREGVKNGVDLKLEPIQRVFFYLPLEHSEEMQDQDLSVERFASLVLCVPHEERGTFRNYLSYAWAHYEIIKQWGRYPHRNDILGREASPQEVEFLKQPGSSFL